jgi:hypothetical protein
MSKFCVLAIITILVVSCSPAQPATTPIPAQPTAAPVVATPAPTATSPAPTVATTAVPATATAATAPARSVVGVWVDKAQPETVQVEFKDSGEMQFRMRVKMTSAGATTYGDWQTAATLSWKQTGSYTIELAAGDKQETWRIDWGKPTLLQPKSTGGTTEFIRP